jgi:hypothetical protein
MAQVCPKTLKIFLSSPNRVCFPFIGLNQAPFLPIFAPVQAISRVIHAKSYPKIAPKAISGTLRFAVVLEIAHNTRYRLT